jgi:hypothetical protein
MSAPKVHNFSTYTNLRCRCDVCRAANTEWQRRRRAERRKELAAGTAHPEHGKASTYENWGCRCRSCTTAHNADTLANSRRRRAARGAS